MLCNMPARLQITIELELTAPVSGSLTASGQPPARFSGWLELHSALEEVCAGAAPVPLQPQP